jgi:hypothetical protein
VAAAASGAGTVGPPRRPTSITGMIMIIESDIALSWHAGGPVTVTTVTY